MSQGDLARACNVAVSTISRLEAAAVSPQDELKWKIAQVLGVPMNDLWAWPDDAPPEAAAAPTAPSLEPAPSVLTVKQVADLLGVHPATLYAHLESGKFPLKPLNLPGRTRFSRAQVERFLAGEPPA